MSRDIQLAWPCPHVIGEERVALEADRRSLYTRQPIGGAGLLQLRVNDRDLVPAATGIQSRARLKSGRPEPYLIRRGEDVLEVRTGTRYFSLTIPEGRYTASEMAARIQAVVLTEVDATAENGYLVVTDRGSLGSQSRVQVGGTAKTALGFQQQSGANGRVVIPTWTLYSRLVPGSTETLGYYIRFDEPVRGNPYYAVTYTVAPHLCMRCLGLRVENDYRYDSQNETVMVRDHDLLYQACLKIILTQIGSNPYYSWYGTNLKQSIGLKANSGAALAMQQTVRKALQSLQDQQAAQAKYQRLSAKERIYAVDSVQASQSPVDPTVFLIDVVVRSLSNDPVNITIVYTTPGAYALQGTNGLSLGLIG